MTAHEAEVGKHADAPGTTPERLPPRPLSHHLALTVYWLSNTILWGALLHLGIQSRLADWYGEGHVGYYMGILGFAGGILGTAGQIVAGAFSDRSMSRWGRRRPYIVVGSMLGVGTMMLVGAAKSFWPFAGAMVLLQLTVNAAAGPFTALLPDTVNPREHGKASGFMGVARLLGDTGGLILAARLLTVPPGIRSAGHAAVTAFHGDRLFLMCGIMGGFMLLTVVYTCFAIREEPLRSRPKASASRIVLDSFALDVRANRDFFWLSISRAVTNFGFYMFLEYMPYFVMFSLRRPNPESATMTVMLPAIAAATLSSIPSGMLSDRLGRRPLIFLAQYLMAAGALMFVLSPGMGFSIFAAIPAGLAYGVFTAVEWAFACNLLPRGEAARYLGIWNASAVVPQILALPLGGIIGSAISAHYPGMGWRVVFGIAAACSLAGAYFLKFAREHRPATEGN